MICELALAEDLHTRFRIYIANDDDGPVRHLLTHPQVALGLSDAGAHVGQLCDAPLPLDFLGHMGARPRRSCRSSAPCASSPANRPTSSGSSTAATCVRAAWADLTRVRSRRRSAPGPTRRVRDFPAGGERLTAEEPVGLRHVLVNGTPIRRDEVQLDASVRPGMRPQLG